jgi:hypothetical protein
MRGVQRFAVACSHCRALPDGSRRAGNALREDFGREDFGREDFGREDFGREDFGREDFGREDFGGEELGEVTCSIC